MEIVKLHHRRRTRCELEVQSQLGQGTTFTLRVPLTISIVDAFSFECGQQRFVVPVTMVDEIIEVDANALVQIPANDDGSPTVEIVSRRGVAIPMIQLAQVFRLETGPKRGSKAIVVRRAGAPVAFAVDRMLGQQEVVIRPINDVLVRAPGVSGATDLGDGRPRWCSIWWPSAKASPRRPSCPRGRDEVTRGVHLAGAEYALPFDSVLQMESYTGATLVPGSPAYVDGIVTVRGVVVPVVDLRARLGLPSTELSLDTRIIVTESDARIVALRVDSARGAEARRRQASARPQHRQ